MIKSGGARVRTLDGSTPLQAEFQDASHRRSHHCWTKPEDLDGDGFSGQKNRSFEKIANNSKIPSDASDSDLASQLNPIAADAQIPLDHFADKEDADHFPSLSLAGHAGDVDSSEAFGRLNTLFRRAETSPDAGGALNSPVAHAKDLGSSEDLGRLDMPSLHDKTSPDAGGALNSLARSSGPQVGRSGYDHSAGRRGVQNTTSLPRSWHRTWPHATQRNGRNLYVLPGDPSSEPKK